MNNEQLQCLSQNDEIRQRWRYEDEYELTPQPTGKPPRGKLLIGLLLIGIGIVGFIYVWRSLQMQ